MTLFDHRSWFEKQPQDKISKTDPNKTFRYVTEHHPYMGCATEWGQIRVQDVLKMSNEDAAAYCDAVTYYCTDIVGKEAAALSLMQYKDLQLLNETSVGNCAYISIHHSDEKTRKLFATALKYLRTLL